jgi:HEPN domain-containing protein
MLDLLMENNGNSKKGFEEPLEKGKKLIGLKQSAFKDYIAARILFLNVQLHQAAFFANTCIEKELKACLYSLNVECNVQHNTFKLLYLLKVHDKTTFDKINPDFIKVLTKIYESRYHEGLNPSYNFVIVKRKFLAELDYTYQILERKVRYKLRSIKGDMSKSLYEIAVQNKFSTVVLENYLYTNILKERFLEEKDDVFEFRIVFNHEVIEASYSIPRNIEFNKFIYEALISSNNNRSFKISNHQPGITNVGVTRNGILQYEKKESS